MRDKEKRGKASVDKRAAKISGTMGFACTQDKRVAKIRGTIGFACTQHVMQPKLNFENFYKKKIRNAHCEGEIWSQPD